MLRPLGAAARARQLGASRARLPGAAGGTRPAARIAMIPGDGIGVDVSVATLRVLRHCEASFGFSLKIDEFPWNSTGYYETHGECAPMDMIDTLRGYDAIFLGALGWPDARPDHITLEPLIRMRQAFGQFACVRPARTYAGVPHPLSRAPPIDLVVVRENSEGEYADVGGRMARGTQAEVAVQAAVHTRAGVERALRFGLDLATSRRSMLTLVTKSNAQRHSMPLWDETLAELAPKWPDVRVERMHVDFACMEMVRRPDRFDVLVASNLFGDLLTDLSAQVCGALGLAPSANLDPTRAHPSLFEPVHGSAPDIAGQGVANPAGAFLSAAMMLEWLGPSCKLPAAAPAAIREAVDRALAAHESTADVGGNLSTEQVADAVIRRIVC